jgi:periplasmic divalent cation tolerance protein
VSAWIVFTTAPDKRTAQKLAKGLVEKKLAACVNVLEGATSTYRWKGKVETSRECLVTVKTSARLSKKVIAHIEKSHSYDVPEAVAVKVGAGSTKYLDWIEKSLK